MRRPPAGGRMFVVHCTTSRTHVAIGGQLKVEESSAAPRGWKVRQSLTASSLTCRRRRDCQWVATDNLTELTTATAAGMHHSRAAEFRLPPVRLCSRCDNVVLLAATAHTATEVEVQGHSNCQWHTATYRGGAPRASYGAGHCGVGGAVHCPRPSAGGAALRRSAAGTSHGHAYGHVHGSGAFRLQVELADSQGQAGT